jgi:hypothetical protein
LGEVRDFGIAVSDAIRVNDCYYQLTAYLTERPALPDDHHFWRTRAAASPGNEEWVHRVNSRDMAEHLLRDAVLNQNLTIWIRLEHDEAPVDGYSIRELSHRSLAAGTYIPNNESQQYLYGRPLWIKRVDWEALFQAIRWQRYGEKPKAQPQPTSKTTHGPTPLSQAKLEQYWAKQSDSLRHDSQVRIINAARDAFPENHISRDRIRELIGPRKRGPKPIRG